VLAKAGRLEAVVAFDTGLSTPEWKQHVQETCEKRKWRLLFYKTDYAYEQFVLKYGFPGPARHDWIMRYLKGRCVRQFRKAHPDGILASGVRSDESQKRAGSTKPFGQWEGAPILAPIHDWSTAETWNYFIGEGFERSPAYSTLQISGDCLCGAYAREDEKAALEFHYPQIGSYFRDLGAHQETEE
jgi:3'-phosphoadenosine 5'-phosphosulfate sulfotransferase (PAPS reductase)/FAD synthetase